MGIIRANPGDNVPESFNVVIEIPSHGNPVKYEVDKDSGALVVDRFLSTCMYYPCNYGYIPQTLADDGDPSDVLVITPVPLMSGVVIECRAIGIMKMVDEAGDDHKILALPIDKLCKLYHGIQKPQDLPAHQLAEITHFFEHYKDLEDNKWVRVDGWDSAEAAKKEVQHSREQYLAQEAK